MISYAWHRYTSLSCFGSRLVFTFCVMVQLAHWLPIGFPLAQAVAQSSIHGDDPDRADGPIGTRAALGAEGSPLRPLRLLADECQGNVGWDGKSMEKWRS